MVVEMYSMFMHNVHTKMFFDNTLNDLEIVPEITRPILSYDTNNFFFHIERAHGSHDGKKHQRRDKCVTGLLGGLGI